MGEREILCMLKVLPYVAAMLLMLLLAGLHRQHPRKLILRKYEEFSGLLKEKSRNTAWYHRTEEILRRNGAAFHYGKGMSPIVFLAVKVIAAALGFLAGCGISFGLAACAGGILFLLPGLTLHYLNRRDNERMLPEIQLVYQTMSMQIQAGIYVTDALAECYGSVRDARLRQAFLKLAGDIVMKGDVLQALEDFQGQFDNRYIDSLCITMLQALESGQAVELLNDIGEQLKDMEMAILEKRKGSLDRSITFYQLGVLAAVLGVALYACVSYMLSRALNL